MLRVEYESSSALTPLQQHERTIESKDKTTPFKALVSPFTATVPFTAPSTPCSSSLTPVPRRLSSMLTPCASLPSDSPASTPSFTPDSHSFFSCSDDTKRFSSGFGAEFANHLLTPKQVRELRRLCRKTANRAEFEGRLIQVRQVASISAMGSSSVHLFDPSNPRSGQELRIWVETHRRSGADWRDERPLSRTAVAELRRWDRQLKAWARSRIQNHPASVPAMYERCSSNIVSRNAQNRDSTLQPVRLQFEQVSIEAPAIPLYDLKQNKEREKSDIGESRVGAVPPVVPNQECASFPGRMGGVEKTACSEYEARFAGYPGIHAEEKQQKISDALPTVRSPWRQALFSAPWSGTDGRKPLSEVVINKRDDVINITVPQKNIPYRSTGPIRKNIDDLLHIDGMGALEKENLLNIRYPSLWGNTFSQTTTSRGRDSEGLGQNGSAMRLKNSEHFHGPDERGMETTRFRSSSKSKLDWGALRSSRGNV
ncbi:hypothetical protein FGB62_121g014 [Gracilaria domingensis]|nr:hypothetical protein FGB62_121g014 [Gracilaria domingensis]